MIKFTLKRILIMIPVLLGVIVIAFTLSYFMPGDPVANQLGPTYTEEEYEAKREEMGLDRPYFVRLSEYVWGVVTRFNLGTSYDTHQDVMVTIRGRIWTSVKLGLLSCLTMIVIALPFGIVSATRQYSGIDYTVTTLSIFFASMPGFWLALMAMLLFSLKLRWLPASGLTTWKHYILPVVCSAISSVASTTRMTRSSMLEVVRQDYIRTARAKGLKEGVVIRRHAFKNALIPVITVIGTQASIIVGGSVVIETIFTIPGMGTLLVSGVNNRDYPLIMGVTIIISIFVCCINLLVDIVYSMVDPRIKAQFSGSSKALKFSGKKPEKEGGTA